MRQLAPCPPSLDWPMAQVAEATGAALVLVRHLSKGSTGQAACYRGLGSLAILAAVRTAFLIARDPDDSDRRVLACTKNNLAVFPPTLAFRVVGTPGGVARIEWLGPVERTADQLVRAGCRRGAAVGRAIDFLQEHLHEGWVEREGLVQQAAREGISFRTLERAKAELGVVSQPRRQGQRNVWYWTLAD
jgi:hypothetical protein